VLIKLCRDAKNLRFLKVIILFQEEAEMKESIDIQVTSTNIQTADEVLTLLRAIVQEGACGCELLTRMLDGMRRDMRGFLSQGKVEMNIGGKKYRVSKEAATIGFDVGLLADKWQKDLGNDFLSLMTVETLDQLLAMLRQRIPVTLTVISADRGTIAVSAPGQPGLVAHAGAVLLAFKSLNLLNDEVRRQIELEGEVRLMPVMDYTEESSLGIPIEEVQSGPVIDEETKINPQSENHPWMQIFTVITLLSGLAMCIGGISYAIEEHPAVFSDEFISVAGLLLGGVLVIAASSYVLVVTDGYTKWLQVSGSKKAIAVFTMIPGVLLSSFIIILILMAIGAYKRRDQ
jgi:hypothetical protein